MRRLKTSALLLIAVGFMASCSYKTCPAYTHHPTQAPQNLQASTQAVSTAAVSTGAATTGATISVGR